MRMAPLYFDMPASSGLRYRVEAVEPAVPVWALPGLDQGEKSGQPGDASSARRDMVRGRELLVIAFPRKRN
jgi:hypothetical protein